MIGGDFAKFCGLLRLYELWYKKKNIEYLYNLISPAVEWRLSLCGTEGKIPTTGDTGSRASGQAMAQQDRNQCEFEFRLSTDSFTKSFLKISKVSMLWQITMIAKIQLP